MERLPAAGMALGLRANWRQFSLLVLVNAFVGAMVGMERSILPALAEHEFKLVAHTAILAFIVVFGISKALTNLRDPNLSSISQAGLVNNLNDGMAWGLFPLVFASAGMSLMQIGTLAAIYPAVWGICQLFTGVLSDRIGRKGLIVAGMWMQAGGIAATTATTLFSGFVVGAILLGLGTAMVYPTLLASIDDVVNPAWRASTMGVYRLWRDMGYAIGALLSGLVADAFGVGSAMWLVAALTFLSGVIVVVRMRETKTSRSAT